MSVFKDTKEAHVSAFSSRLSLSCRLDIHSTTVTGQPLPRRLFEWSLSELPSPSSSSSSSSSFTASNSRVLVSSNKTMFNIRGRTKEISPDADEEVFEMSLLQSLQADIRSDSEGRAIVIEFSGYASILESAVVVLSLGSDRATSQSMFMRCKLFFKEDLQHNICLDSIQHFTAEIGYNNLCMSAMGYSERCRESWRFRRDDVGQSTRTLYGAVRAVYGVASSVVGTVSKYMYSTNAEITAEGSKGEEGEHSSKAISRSFFANGWNAWSFCGSVLQGTSLPLYNMPNACVKAFHSGGAALGFNLTRQRGSQDWIASDMFTVIADRYARAGVVVGFLSQKQQFGCITSNEEYSIFSVYTAHDGAHVDRNSRCVETDWLCVEVSPALVSDPLANYMHLSGLISGAHAKVNLSPSEYTNTLLDLSKLSSIECKATDDRSLDEDTVIKPCELEEEDRPFNSVQHVLPVGWCSWYHFFEHITEACLNENIEELTHITAYEPGAEDVAAHHNCTAAETHDLRCVHLFQVDDGYQSAWGDWATLKKREFPSSSLRPLVARIRRAGLVPGIWMAPFSCDKHSIIASEHPSWILRNPNKAPANSANCGKWFYGLDITNTEVQAHVRNSIRHVVRDWGFRYLKLDFLYSGILAAENGSLSNKNLTGAQAMQLGMTTVAQAVADIEEQDAGVLVLGCGAPLGSVIGHVHLNRISADAGLTW